MIILPRTYAISPSSSYVIIIAFLRVYREFRATSAIRYDKIKTIDFIRCWLIIFNRYLWALYNFMKKAIVLFVNFM